MGRAIGPLKEGPYALVYQDNSTFVVPELNKLYDIIENANMKNMHMCRRRDEYIAASRIYVYFTALFWYDDTGEGLLAFEPMIEERYTELIIDSIETIGWQAVARLLMSYKDIEQFKSGIGGVLARHTGHIKMVINQYRPRDIKRPNNKEE